MAKPDQSSHAGTAGYSLYDVPVLGRLALQAARPITRLAAKSDPNAFPELFCAALDNAFTSAKTNHGREMVLGQASLYVDRLTVLDADHVGIVSAETALRALAASRFAQSEGFSQARPGGSLADRLAASWSAAIESPEWPLSPSFDRIEVALAAARLPALLKPASKFLDHAMILRIPIAMGAGEVEEKLQPYLWQQSKVVPEPANGHLVKAWVRQVMALREGQDPVMAEQRASQAVSNIRRFNPGNVAAIKAAESMTSPESVEAFVKKLPRNDPGPSNWN